MSGTTDRQEMLLADWAHSVQPSRIQQLLAIATQPNILSFALGLPAAELFPIQAYQEAAIKILQTDTYALQYAMPLQTLKRYIVDIMAQRGVICSEEQVFLTTGAQQGMNLLARLLLNSGGSFLLEEYIYSGIIQATEPLRPGLLTVPTDPSTGMDIEAVAAHLEKGQRPAFIYAISDGHNPMGISMSREKRQRLVALAQAYHVPIIEDDAYGLLEYDEQPVPPLRAFEDESVIYIGSFSKILAPALRTGWMIVPERLVPTLSALKEGSDINTATFSQRSIAAYLEMGQFASHLAMLRNVYRKRRDTMIEAIQKHFQQKYGDVLVDVEELTPIDEHAAHIRVAISKDMSFVTRYYGDAYYDGEHLSLKTKAI